MKTIIFFDYAYNAIRESINALGITSEIVEYYGDKEQCAFEDYFSAQIKDGNIYDATDTFDEENLIGSIKENIFEVDFEDARERAFKEWFEELVENVDEDDLIDVSSEVSIEPQIGSDDEGNEFVEWTMILYKGKSPDIIDYENSTEGYSLFTKIFGAMSDYGNQDVRKAAILADAKYVYCDNSDDEDTLYFWK